MGCCAFPATPALRSLYLGWLPRFVRAERVSQALPAPAISPSSIVRVFSYGGLLVLAASART